MDYRCLRHLSFVTKDDADEYIRLALSLLKGKGVEGGAALDLLAGIVATGDGTYTKVILDAVSRKSEESEWRVAKKTCASLLSFLEEGGVHCDCSDCGLYRLNKRKKYNAELDADILRWCLCDTLFVSEMVGRRDLKKLMDTGILSSPVCVLSTPDCSCCIPLYRYVYDTISVVSYMMYDHQYGDHVGINEEDYKKVVDCVVVSIRNELTGTYNAEALDQIEKNCRKLLCGLNNAEHLKDRRQVLDAMESVLVKDVVVADVAAVEDKPCVVSVTPVLPETSVSEGDSISDNMPNTILEDAKREFRQQEKARMSDKRNADNKNSRDGKSGDRREKKADKYKTDDSPAEEVRQTYQKPEREPVRIIYPYTQDMEAYTELSTAADFERLFYMLIEGSTSRLPMEMTEDAAGCMTAIIHVSVPVHPEGEFYRIPERAFSVLMKSRVFSKAKPLTFLPFAVLSQFDSLRKVYSIGMGYDSLYADTLSITEICNEQRIPGTTGADLSFPNCLRYYGAVYERLLAILNRETREYYQSRIYEAVYRSQAFRMQQLTTISERKERYLFKYSQRRYRYHYNLHSLCATDGYLKLRVRIPNLRTEKMLSIVDYLSESFCTHSYFRGFHLAFIGTIESEKEFEFICLREERERLLEVLRLDFLRITPGITEGTPEIIIEEEVSQAWQS